MRGFFLEGTRDRRRGTGDEGQGTDDWAGLRKYNNEIAHSKIINTQEVFSKHNNLITQ